MKKSVQIVNLSGETQRKTKATTFIRSTRKETREIKQNLDT